MTKIRGFTAKAFPGKVSVLSSAIQKSAALKNGKLIIAIFINAMFMMAIPARAVTIIDGGDIVTVPDTQPSPWDIIGDIDIGDIGSGTLNVFNGGSVTNSGYAYIGRANGSGEVNISGPGSSWNHDGSQIFVGHEGNGALNITDGGVLSSGPDAAFINGNDGVFIGNEVGVRGIATVSGAGSKLDVNSGSIIVGLYGTGILNITDGGESSGRRIDIGSYAGSSGIATLSGVDSIMKSSERFVVGVSGTGIFDILAGGVVANEGIGYIGANAAGHGTATVSGIGSQWNNTDALYLGLTGAGTLTITDNGEVSASSLVIARYAGSSGTLNIGSAAGEVASTAGTLDTTSITFGDGNGQINFNHTDTSGSYTFAPAISGVGNIDVYSGTTAMSGLSDYSGATTIYGGTLAAGTTGAFSRNANYITESGGTVDLRGYSQTMGSLNHSGDLNFGSVPGTILTIAGDYTGNNGLLNFNTLLSDDTSATDKLVVEGNTSGTTLVTVTNAGGSGAYTLNGIELITVAGVSDGEFIQNGRIVAGAYDYYLERGIGSNEANWYLNNTMPAEGPGSPGSPGTPGTPGEPSPVMIERPEASGYSANLAAANNMFVTRLHDRLGETQYIDALTGEQKVTSMWLRSEGGHNRFRDTQDQLGTQSNRYVMQLGGDIAQWSNDGLDRFHLGIMAGYGNSKSTTESRLSGYSARASVDGYSTGLYGTWYANSADKTGLYVDSWAQYSWFNNTVNGQDLAVEEYKSKGVTASVESGYTFKVGENVAKNASYFIQPKAQVTWMGVKADDHKEANGTNVSGEGNGNIQTRLGVRAFMSGYADQDKGKDRVFQPFVEANWIHNTKDFGTTMDGMTVKQAGAANIGELKLGVEGQLSKKVNVWGNVGQQVGNKGYSDTAVMLGVKYNF
ncbi:autotransporter outer membrane beta-barrel domain-containing protein [Yersinia alsatica]|uniref:autotransporter outer membrane beta-barrel domain-containing protein n=1 Tax=Yersinia alsatica TaxID=2890317 RepID=UPI001F2482B2|nr:autotransporter outer membrane beta-barrel domain-containing protein [Yersinia alsatica]